jgi:tellurite resistance protein TehA-like permease
VAAIAVRRPPFPAAADGVALAFLGAPPMACLTVGSGALLVGHDLVGRTAAQAIAFPLIVLATVTGLLVAVLVPGRIRLVEAPALGLLPVVPPMVSAAACPGLVAHLPAGAPRVAALGLCAALLVFALALAWSALRALAARLRADGPGPGPVAPTLWLVLGPLGQSVTAINLLANAAHDVLPEPLAAALRGAALGYGLPVFALALAWLVAAVATVARAALRRGLPFSWSWWAFTFPVGTVVTAGAELAGRTGVVAYGWTAAALLAPLLAGWLAAAAGTTRALARRRVALAGV